MSATAQLINTPREVLAGGRIKGGMMAAHLAWATNGRSESEVARFWSLVPNDVRELLGGMILPVNWYEFADLIAVDRAIVRVYGGGDDSVLREVGAHSARLNLNGVYKVYRRDSIHEFLETGARLHSKFQDFGDAAYVKSGPSAGAMVHRGYPSYSPLYCQSALGYYRESIKLHGAQNIVVDETSCQCLGAESCAFALRWH